MEHYLQTYLFYKKEGKDKEEKDSYGVLVSRSEITKQREALDIEALLNDKPHDADIRHFSTIEDLAKPVKNELSDKQGPFRLRYHKSLSSGDKDILKGHFSDIIDKW